MEPSMEDILSSIKRIIAEEGEAPQARARRGSRAPAAAPLPGADPLTTDDEHDEVLELNDPMPMPGAPPPPVAAAPPPQETPPMAQPAVAPKASAAPAASAPVAGETVSPIVSQQTAAATRGSLDSLSRLLVKPEPASDGTLEGLVREMLRPMLRDWLDANLPPMVESMVAREIAKITGQGG